MSEPILVSGTDFSTDKVQTVVIKADDGNVVLDTTFDLKEVFGKKYGLEEGGFLRGEGGAVRIPYGLLADGIDHSIKTVCEGIERNGFQRKQWKRITMSFQQHGMGAWLPGTFDKLWAMGKCEDVDLSLSLPLLFATDMATSWMDTSSRNVCDHFERMKLADYWAGFTGSAPTVSLRFLGPQVTRLFKEDPLAFRRTQEFTVLASIGATLLTGRRQGIGIDEASMTLLMNLERGQWSKTLLRQCYPKGLSKRLPIIFPAGTELGLIWNYWARRYGLPGTCRVHMGFGDNIAADLTAPGVKLSLGSSGTVYQDLDHATYDPTHACHVLRNGKGGFMGMYVTDLCGKLANKVREAVGLSWDRFNANVAHPQWTDPTETVFVHDGQILYFAGGANVAAAVTRSILMNIRRHCAFMGKPPYIVATGGFAKPEVAQIAADILGCSVYVTPSVNRVAYGSAIWSLTQETRRPLNIVAARLCPTGEEIKPDSAHSFFYKQFGEAFARNFPC